MTENKAPTLESQAVPSDDPDHMAGAYADRLMNELFGGIERALEGDPDALAEPAQSESVPQPEPASEAKTELTLSFSEGGLPAVLLAEQSGDLPIHVPETSEPTALSDEPIASLLNETISHPQKGWRNYLTSNRALLGAAGLVVVAATALWFSQRQPVPTVVSAPAPSAAPAPAVSAEAEFLEYLRRSLNIISENAGGVAPTASAATTAAPTAVTLNGGAGLPTIVGNNVLPPPGGTPLANAGPLNVIERVYVPYQAAPSQVPATPLPVPNTTAVPSVVPNTTVPPTIAAAPAAVHKLMGIFELGDRSAAMFDIDGVTQRVYIGEQIGGSGWSLVSVANEEAVIRRNGEVRSIYIGQQF
ncbi:MAG: hypothetical protein ACFBSF_18335 [Leptolyngbyaceae cyanobacterium]